MQGYPPIKLDPSKPTILVCTDSAHHHTGLGRLARTIFNKVVSSGKFNVVQHGWWHREGREDVKFPVYPTTITPDGIVAPDDKYGERSFVNMVERVKPDIVWVCADPWRVEHFTDNQKRGSYYLIGYCAIDSGPLPSNLGTVLDRFDLMIPYCEWGKAAMETAGCQTTGDAILHGVDLDTFKPLPAEERQEIRNGLFKLEENDFLFGGFGRNISRKYWPAFFEALYYIRSGNYLFCKNCGRISLHNYDITTKKIKQEHTCCVWCKSEDVQHGTKEEQVKGYYHGALQDQGWDLLDLQERYQLVGSMLFNADLRTAGVGVSDTALNKIYNACDAFVLPTTCEGFGLPIVEAMAVGVPCILTDTSAYLEWAGDAALIVPSAYTQLEVRFNLQRNLISVPDLVLSMLRMIKEPELREDLRNKGFNVAAKLDWNNILPKWETIFSTFNTKATTAPWQIAKPL